MKIDLLAKLLPQSASLSKGSKVNDAITSDDINIKLSYSKITDAELNFILAKFLDDDLASLIGIKPQKFKKKAYNKIINKLMDIEDSALSKIGDT
jgi:hypothetical protein